MQIPTFIEMSGAIFRRVKYRLDNARIKTLGSNPLLLISAPGPGQAIDVLAATLSIRSTVGYTTGGNVAQLFIGVVPSTFFGQFDNGMFTAGTNLVQITSAIFTGNDDLVNVENQPLFLSTDGNADYTGGADGNVAIVECFYHLFDV